MERKDLKNYVSPIVEIVDGELESQILAGSPETNPFDDSTWETEEME